MATVGLTGDNTESQPELDMAEVRMEIEARERAA